MKLSKRLSRSEFSCECGCGFDTVDIKLIEVLEDVCEYVERSYKASRVIIHILSGCRCPKHNEVVQLEHTKGYVPNSSKSTHMYGIAADFYLEVITRNGKRIVVPPSLIATYLEASYPDNYGIGRYINRVHLDVKTGRARRW